MSGRVALITGGNRGLGLATACKLAARGCRVVVTARKAEAGAAAVATLRARVPRAEAHSLTLDLTSFASIRACAGAFHALGLPLHILINNAGLMQGASAPSFTVEGFETTLGTNHIGHFLLTHLLLPDLVRAAPSRVVVVSSGMHRPEVGSGPGPDFDYTNLKAEKSFHRITAYRNSKLANLWFAHELARRLADKDVAVVAVSPGWMPETQAAQASSLVQRLLMRYVYRCRRSARTLSQGSNNSVFAALDPALQRQSGGFFEDQQPGIVSDEARDATRAARLWAESLTWTGLTEDETAAG